MSLLCPVEGVLIMEDVYRGGHEVCKIWDGATGVVAKGHDVSELRKGVWGGSKKLQVFVNMNLLAGCLCSCFISRTRVPGVGVSGC